MKKLLPLLLILSSCNFSIIETFRDWDNAKASHKAGAVILTILSGGTAPLGGLIVHSSDAPLKDLETMGAKIESQNTDLLAQKLNIRFGLSEYRSQEVARTIHYYSKKAKAGSLTKKDSERFLKSVLGVNMKELVESQNNGESLLEKISEKNETSPEHIRSLISDIFYL